MKSSPKEEYRQRGSNSLELQSSEPLHSILNKLGYLLKNLTGRTYQVERSKMVSQQKPAMPS